MKKMVCALLFGLICLPVIVFGQDRVNIPLASFNGIEIDAGINVSISQNAVCGVFIEATEELRNEVQVNIDKKGILHITLSDKLNKHHKSNQVQIYIKAPEFTKISLSKTASLTVESDLDCLELEIELSDNAAFYSKKINAKKINMKANGNGVFQGTVLAKDLKINASGKSKLNITEADISNSLSFILKDKANVQVYKLSGDKLEISAKDHTLFSASFDGKNVEVKSAGSSRLTLSGNANSANLTAKNISVINIRDLQCNNIKTSTEKTGIIER